MRKVILVTMAVSMLIFSCAQQRQMKRGRAIISQPHFDSPNVRTPSTLFLYKPQAGTEIKEIPLKPKTKEKAKLPQRTTKSIKKKKRAVRASSRFLRIATNTMAEKGVKILKRNQLDKARDHFERVINIDTSNPEAYYYLGVITFRKKQYKQSILFFKKALYFYKGNSPKKALSLYQIGIVYKTMKKGRKAQKYFKLSRDENPKSAIPDPLLMPHGIL